MNGAKSEWAPVLFGVPQSTFLGPLLVSLNIIDIIDDINPQVRLFADGCV